MEKYRELRECVEKVGLVDAHAHNIVAVDSTFPFLRCFSEAEGDALDYAPHTLSFKRSLKDIARLYGCEASLSGIETHRRSFGLDSTGSKCFGASNISAIFIDDGIELDKMHDVEWHTRFTPAVGRVLRIERLAEKILDEEKPNGSEWTLDLFTEIFIRKLKSVADKIVALKSIAAYRSGLEIDTHANKDDAEKGLIEDLATKPVRIQNKGFIDYVFTLSLEVAVCFDLPLQIHTGDLDLRLCNPLHLRTVLEDKRFSECRIVLLHASYPFSKEASYLASVYSQIHLDFGLAVPKLSIHGMISAVKELLELAPIKKVMFSTDGYAFPETFYLGAKRARETVLSVLSDACDDGDLTIPEAVEAVEDIFKHNALRLYKINCIYGSLDSKNAITCNYDPIYSNSSRDNIEFVRILWVDASGQHRCRAIPAKRFYEIVRNSGVGLAVACMGMTSSSDGPAEGTNLTAVGEIRLIPDLSTKQRLPWSHQEEMVLADMQLKPGESWECCPREALRRISKVLKEEFNLEMNSGFENEFFLLKNVLREGKTEWAPFDSTPYCSTSAFDAISPVLREVNSDLQSMGISVEQLHAESGNGQFEIVLAHRRCTHAADNLVLAREVIRAVARKHGLLATFVPKYSLDDIGSGSHVHLSLWTNGKNVFMASDESKTLYGMSKVGEEFMAGVLYHLPSIMAFTAPLPNSYDRIQPNTWSGAYHCWGKENREAPLRTACPPGISIGLVSNFEVKTFDGCANPYLGLASIIASGIDGLRRNLSLPEPVETNPSNHHGVLKRLPKVLSESVEALEKDIILKDLIGEKLVTAVIGVRKAEIDYYSKNKDAFKQLIHRY
ncbi:nodulin/glutamine synthase-like protein isoform X2 [Tasmannia lanceolata]|uniref:nodulin/glutamine synthase-like protein isoform X2 n=1 Tax=Tasmannia lanceolata TaxID=3420 RepID=UPI00406289C3